MKCPSQQRVHALWWLHGDLTQQTEFSAAFPHRLKTLAWPSTAANFACLFISATPPLEPGFDRADIPAATAEDRKGALIYSGFLITSYLPRVEWLRQRLGE